MKIAIIINIQRLTDELTAKLNSDELTAKYQITYDLFIVPPDAVNKTLTALNFQAYNAIIIGGGDGTVCMAITHLIKLGKPIPLAILPLGTFNLLAHSLKHPNDIDALFAMIKNNKCMQVDTAEVNHYTMINHAWIGFYYHMLKAREQYREFLGKSKILKILFNTFNIFKSLPFYHLEFHMNGEIKRYKTCLVFIGNNESYSNFFNFGEHKQLSTGLLSVNILNCKNRCELFLFLVSMLFNNPKNSDYLISFNCDNLQVSSKKDDIKTVIDGELYHLKNPLHFKIHPKKLMVLIP